MKKTKALTTTSHLEKLSKQELLKMVQDSLLPINNPEMYKDMVKKAMPEFVKEMENKEDMATSIFESGQELMLVLIDCLKRYHNWNQIEIKQLLKELTDVLTGVKEFEKNDLAILSIHSVSRVGDLVEQRGIQGLLADIAALRFEKNRVYKTGIQLPSNDAEKLLR